MKQLFSLVLIVVLGIALSAFSPTKQEIKTECTTHWEQGDVIQGPGNCTVTQFYEVKECDGVTQQTGRTREISSCLSDILNENGISESGFDSRVENMSINRGTIDYYSTDFNLYAELSDGSWIGFKVNDTEDARNIIAQAYEKLTGNKKSSFDPSYCGDMTPINPLDPNSPLERVCCYYDCDLICCWREVCPCGYCVCKRVSPW